MRFLRTSASSSKDVLRHRLVLSYEALAEDVTPDQILDKILDAVPMPQLELAREEVA